MKQFNIKGTPEVYTIAVNSFSESGDLEFALMVYNDMKQNGVVPDEVFGHVALHLPTPLICECLDLVNGSQMCCKILKLMKQTDFFLSSFASKDG